jgi:hypothetical protein
MKSNGSHSWKFFRAGGFDQVKLETGADLMNLDQLDQKLWVALACPTTGLEFDPKTAALIDSDKDGRIRASELIASVKWVGGLLKNPDDLIKGSPSLPLASINDATAEGKQLLSSARQILINLGKNDATAISIEDTTDTTKIFSQTKFNGDGVVPCDAATDDTTRAVINDIINCFTAETDRSGKPGIGQAKCDQFFAELQAYSDWWKKAEGDTNILPIGEATVAAANAVRTVKAKVDDYFARCRLAAFDARSVNALNRDEKEYLAFSGKELSLSSSEVAAFPLARIDSEKPLPLDNVNPAWAAAITKFRSDAVKPLLGEKAVLTEGDWTTLLARLGAFECWSAGKAGGNVEKLGLKRVREILASKARDTINNLIAQDKALEPEANSIANVDKFVRYHRDLYLLCINFVNFKDFYDRGEPAIFQLGTLYLDQRSCDLCLPVEDAGRHAAMAGLAGAYLAYCECARKGSGEKRQIVAAFTDGDSDNLMVGRNGIFYDRKGRDWDATITKIIDNPISLRQAFWAPYKKFVRLIEEQIARRAAAADAASAAKLESSATTVAQADQAKAAGAPKKVDVGTVAALGVAFGAIGAFLTALWGHILGIVVLGPLAIVGAIVGLFAFISGPALILAFIKLRKRNLAPVLDANGWAVNAKAKINVPFGRSLTQVATLPAGSQRDTRDPFQERKSPWPKILVLLLLLYIAYAVLNNLGFIYDWTGGRMGVRKEHAPKAAAPTTTVGVANVATNATVVVVTNAPAK